MADRPASNIQTLDNQSYTCLPEITNERFADESIGPAKRTNDADKSPLRSRSNSIQKGAKGADKYSLGSDDEPDEEWGTEVMAAKSSIP